MDGARGAKEAYVSAVASQRAIVFMPQPQDVEVFRGLAWVPGSMVGWRHEDSSCRVLVRVTEGLVEKTAWADLEQVRLPDAEQSRHADPDTVLLTLAVGRSGGSTSGSRARHEARTAPESSSDLGRPGRAQRRRAAARDEAVKAALSSWRNTVDDVRWAEPYEDRTRPLTLATVELSVASGWS